jgi:hypothetical protein
VATFNMLFIYPLNIVQYSIAREDVRGLYNSEPPSRKWHSDSGGRTSGSAGCFAKSSVLPSCRSLQSMFETHEQESQFHGRRLRSFKQLSRAYLAMNGSYVVNSARRVRDATYRPIIGHSRAFGSPPQSRHSFMLVAKGNFILQLCRKLRCPLVARKPTEAP